MPLISTSVPNLVQGVSQQPDNLRHAGQAENQVNALSSVVDGLTKRPNTDHVKVIGTNGLATKMHVFNRDANNQHAFLFTHNDTTASLVAKNLANGNDVPVTISTAAQTYLNTATAPSSQLSVLSVADFTFVASNRQTVAMAGTTSTALANEAIVFVKQGNNTSTYTVTIDGTATTHTASSHSSESIATALASAITSASISGVSSVTANGSVIKIVMSSDLSVTVSDSISNTALGVVYKDVNYITDLPARCFNGHRVKVKGDIELSQDDYYVKFVTKNSAAFGVGSWEEDIGYGITTTLDNTTMPMRITPAFTGSSITAYTIDVATWTNRLVGDLNTSPNPSFVGKTINDVFFYKNRLGMLTDGSILFSESDEYFNFFRTTVLTLLDGAPIDVGIAHTKVTTLKNAIPFQEKLMLFSNETQFVLQGTDLLTPKTVNISPVTEYEKKDAGNPIALSNFLYFTYSRGNFTGAYEYYVDSSSETYDAVDLTSQVPAYLPSSVYELIGSSNENTIIGRDASTNDLYVYRYFWTGKDKIQSSWSKFTFANNITGIGVIESTLYLITYDGTNQNLETMDLSPRQADTGKTYKILLDRRKTYDTNPAIGTVTYNSGTRKTTVTGMPYDPVGSCAYTFSGARVTITRVSSSSFTMVGNYADPSITDSTSPHKYLDSFYVGREYDMEFEFSTPSLKQPTERGGRSTSDFTKQILRNGAVEYSETGHFTVEVTPQYRDTYSYAFNPSSLGADSVIGSLVLDDGSFRFPIHSKHDDVTIKLKSSSALPMKILSAEFENFIHARSRRYS